MAEQRIAELERQLSAEVELRKRLVQIAAALGSTLNLDELLDVVLDAARELCNAETSSLLLLDEDSGQLEITLASGGLGDDVEKQRVPAGQGIAGWALQHRQPAVIADPASDERFYGAVDATTGFTTRNLLAVPMVVKDRAIGVAEVINKQGGDSFDDADVERATALASLAAMAIDNAALYAKLADAVVAARMSYRL